MVALEDASLDVRQGEISGAARSQRRRSKTTFIKILATLLVKDAGSVNVLGYDVDARPEEVRHLVGTSARTPSAPPMPV